MSSGNDEEKSHTIDINNTPSYKWSNDMILRPYPQFFNIFSPPVDLYIDLLNHK